MGQGKIHAPLNFLRATVKMRRMALDGNLYKSLVRNINAQSEADLEARIQACIDDCKNEAEEKRRNAIKALNEAWPKMGGSEEDLVTFVGESEVESEASSLTDRVGVDSPQDAAPLNGSLGTASLNDSFNGSLNHAANKEVVEQELRNVLSGPAIGIITQTEIRNTILDKYPNLNEASVRSAVNLHLRELAEQGILELVEKGKAGRPSQYRKKVEEADVERVEVEEVGLLGS